MCKKYLILQICRDKMNGAQGNSNKSSSKHDKKSSKHDKVGRVTSFKWHWFEISTTGQMLVINDLTNFFDLFQKPVNN